MSRSAPQEQTYGSLPITGQVSSHGGHASARNNTHNRGVTSNTGPGCRDTTGMSLTMCDIVSSWGKGPDGSFAAVKGGPLGSRRMGSEGLAKRARRRSLPQLLERAPVRAMAA